MASISAEAVAKAFASQWVFVYGPPSAILSDNGKQFAANFFQALCRTLGTKNVYTTTYNPKCNGQAERFNRTILNGIRHYIDEHPTDWDMYTDALTYAYNTQVHTTTDCTPFELVLSRPPPHHSLEVDPLTERQTAKPFTKEIWLKRLKSMIATAKEKQRGAQRRYKQNFDKKVKSLGKPITTESVVFVRKDAPGPAGDRHKLSAIVDGPFRVSEVDDKTCVIIRNNAEVERISLDRVTPAPDEIRNLAPSGPTTTSRSYDATRHASEDEDIMSHIVDKQVDDANVIRYRVRWYAKSPEEDTWEPITHLPRSQVMRYHRRYKLPLPDDLDDALVG